jgi:hypothetical protein
MNLQGILIGAVAFIVIGVFHPIVIKAEYHLGKRVWPLFLVVGLLALAASLFIRNVIGTAALGVFGFSCLWSIRELYEQAERVERGWFPSNPKRG